MLLATALLMGASDRAVEVTGNRRVPTEILRRLVPIPHQDAGPAALQRTADRIRQVLMDSGYPLASVGFYRRKGTWVLEVDEGTIERVVFPDLSSLSAARASLVFDLEDGVFQEADFREALAELEEALGESVVGFQVILRTESDPLFQISDLDAVEAAVMFPDPGRYTVVIRLTRTFEAPGFGFGLEATGPDGLVASLGHRWAHVATPDDRLVTRGSIGLRIGQLIGGSGVPLVSRGQATVEGYSPRMLGRTRILSRIRFSYLNRQRPDLDASYDLVQPEAAVGLRIEEGRAGNLALAIGADGRALLSGVAPGAPQPTTVGTPRGFMQVTGHLNLFPSRFRLRKDQQLRIGSTVTGYVSRASYLRFDLDGGRSFPLGPHSEIKAWIVGAALAGNSGVLDEIRVSDLLRGLYGDTRFTSRGLKGSGEVFVSLEREYLRVSIFADGIVGANSAFGAQPPTEPFYGFASGVGLHALFLQTVQGSVYGVFGRLTDEAWAGGINLSLARLF